MARIIKLEKIKDDKRLGRGERAIFVDGVCWGRTVAGSRGPHGVFYTFAQEGGGAVYIDEREKRLRQVTVRSFKKRSREGDLRTADEAVLDAVTELVESGKLRDPAVVRAEAKIASDKYNASVAERLAATEARLVEKARETLIGMLDYVPTGISTVRDAHPEDIARVVAAMKWAQEQ